MWFDFQVHSCHSYDSLSRVEDILRVAQRRGLAGLAITDHECFDGAREAARLAPTFGLLLVPAMEIHTEEGDLIGLFLQEAITARTFAGVVEEVRAQGGLTMLPHPFKRRPTLPSTVLEQVDLIEVFNARGQFTTAYDCNARAYQIAQALRKPMVAGSDAHFLWEIGRGAVRLPPVSDLAALKEALRHTQDAELRRQSTSLYYDVLSQLIKAFKLRDPKVMTSNWRRFLKVTRWYLRRPLREKRHYDG